MIALNQICTQCRENKLTLTKRARFICNECKESIHKNQWRDLQTINNGYVVERRGINEVGRI
jgi:ribosomal protein L37AE/L43A